MAKKPSSSARKKKQRAVDQSAVKGGGILSLNKSNTSPFMKVVIVLIIIALVTLFLYGGIQGIIDLFTPQPQAAAPDALATVQAKYDPQVQSYTSVLASDPTSYTILLDLADVHLSYAQDLQTLVSQNSTTAAQLYGQEVTASRDTYQKAVKVNKNAEPGVLVDYSIATFYSGETTSAIKIATGVVLKNPNFPPAHFNLAIYYESANQRALAIAEFQKYLALDPNGTQGNPTYAKQELDKLTASTPATGVPGSSATTP